MLSWVHAVFLTGCGEGGVGRVGEWRSTVCDARVTHVCGTTETCVRGCVRGWVRAWVGATAGEHPQSTLGRPTRPPPHHYEMSVSKNDA